MPSSSEAVLPSLAAARFVLFPWFLIFCLVPTCFLSAEDWDIHTIGDREYVSDENIAKFYGFERFAKEGDDRIFKHPSLIMTWKIGSDVIYVNNIKFRLSFPVIENDGMAMLSTVDLAKLVDPMVRPSYIRKPIEFDTVVIDASHGGHDSGAVGPNGQEEKDYSLDVALRVEKQLKTRGFKTVLTRRDDIFLTSRQRVEIANHTEKAIFVSIHFNSSNDPTACGIETYALAPSGTVATDGISPFLSAPSATDVGNEKDAENVALAIAVHAHLIGEIRSIDLGVSRARFDELRGSNKPGVLVKAGYLTSRSEAELIDSPDHRERLASLIAEGVTRFKSVVGKQ